MKPANGIAVRPLTAWFDEHLDVTPPLTFELIEGGRSNLTYLVVDHDGRRLVLRRPPLHGVLPSAHDMGREYRILAALSASNVPVPVVRGHEPDPTVTGAEFYVMDFVDGDVIRGREEVEARIPFAERRRLGEDLVDVLARIHAVRPGDVGLERLSKGGDYVARQLRRWRGQLDRLHGDGGRDLPALREVHQTLSSTIPQQEEISIVHGDYRLDNVIVGADHGIAAVLDWELCTLGDPRADVGLLAVYWTDPGETTIPNISEASTASGFLRRTAALDRYADVSGRDLGHLDYFLAFSSWKLAVILEGVRTRSLSGAYGEGAADDPFGDVVLDLAERAMEASRLVRAHGRG